MRKSFIFVLLVLTLSTQSFVFAQSGTSSSKLTAPKIERGAAITKSKSLVTGEMIESDLAEALSVIEENYVAGKKLDYNQLFKSSIDGMLHTLDPHSNYFDAKEFEQFRTEQRSEYFGIGATIGDLKEGDTVWTFIRATFENSPAWRAGLRYGDKIVEVNGASMRNKAFYEVRNFLRGPRGTAAKLTVQRHGSNQTRTVEIVRDAVPQPSIPEAYMIKPGVGYIAMTGGFNQTTAGEFQEAMRQLKAQGMEQLVLDLRGNGGGLVNQAYRVANAFLQTGQVVFTQKGRVDGTSHTFRAENSAPERTPLVILVNRNTASASEILAGALQDHDRALIVGESTFGKGLVQQPFPLPYNSALLLTIAKYQTPSGRDIQRDYSNGNLYDYYTQGGTLREERKTGQPNNGAERKTDAGRPVYSGGGIMPDESVKPQTLNQTQQRLNYPVFGFALELSTGRVAGFENFKIDRAIEFGKDLKATDFPVNDSVIAAFKKYVAARPEFGVAAAQIDRERAFVTRQLRFELATAAFGSTTAFQTYNEADPQITRGIELLPRARELAQLVKRNQTALQVP